MAPVAVLPVLQEMPVLDSQQSLLARSVHRLDYDYSR
jgi:hypothetical protein